MRPWCFLDLDGVLVDFVAGALKLHKHHIPYQQVRWDFYNQIGLSSEADFWKDMGYDFWKGLDWTMEGRELLTALEDLFGRERIVLLTSPCLTPGCVDGKLEWVRKNLPSYTRQILVGSIKQAIAAPHKLLVDDNQDNTQKFTDAGGLTVLVPRPWNRLADRAYETGFSVPDLIWSIKTLI